MGYSVIEDVKNDLAKGQRKSIEELTKLTGLCEYSTYRLLKRLLAPAEYQHWKKLKSAYYKIVETVKESLSRGEEVNVSKLAEEKKLCETMVYYLLRKYLTPEEYQRCRKRGAWRVRLLETVHSGLTQGERMSNEELAETLGPIPRHIHAILCRWLTEEEYQLWKKLKPRRQPTGRVTPGILKAIKGEITDLKRDQQTKVSTQSAMSRLFKCSRQNVNRLLTFLPSDDLKLWLNAPKKEDEDLPT